MVQHGVHQASISRENKRMYIQSFRLHSNLFKDKRQTHGSTECTLSLRYLRNERMYIQSFRLLLVNILSVLIKKRRVMVQQGVHQASINRETKGAYVRLFRLLSSFEYFDYLSILLFTYEQ